MHPEEARYAAFVARLETYARKHPTAYRARILLLALLGYAYILLVAALAVAPIVAIGAVIATGRFHAALFKVGWIFVVFAYILLRAVWSALWVRIPPPEGIRIGTEHVPKLVGMVRGLSEALRAPRPHRILLTDDYNACVVQVPLLGILGWQRNYLVLGLPLLHALPPAHLRAVLAHELGHLSSKHSRFAIWVLRTRYVWGELMDVFEEEEHMGAILFVWFLNWYAPYFMAYTFALARVNEYEADRFAAKAVGSRTLINALIDTEVKIRFLRDFSPGEGASSGREASLALQRGLHGNLPTAEAAAWLSEALEARAGYADSHPALADRLRALGCRPLPDGGMALGRDPVGVPEPVKESAAEFFLPASAQSGSVVVRQG